MITFLKNKGGYRKLRVYRLSEIIYDLSMIFAKQYIRQGSRTRDQIEQAARSGKQNMKCTPKVRQKTFVKDASS
ncbi:MAG: hypothetical protein ACI30H_08370, partial [Paludibacteraceae bacterium]